MENSMYKAGSNLLIVFYSYHATGKSMENSIYKAGTKSLSSFIFTMPLVDP